MRDTLDLAAIRFAHRDCAWCRTLDEDQRDVEGCSVARLMAEVERLSGWGGNWQILASDFRTRAERSENILAKIEALHPNNGGWCNRCRTQHPCATIATLRDDA